MNRLESVVAASSLLLVVCAPAAAQCITPGSIDEEFAQATAVFDGTVSAVHYLPNTDCCHVYSGMVTFAVTRWWKGPGGGQIGVDAYGYIFALGREYVVFASGTPPAASICSRAKPTSDSADTLRWLSEKPSRVADAASAPSAAITRRDPGEFKELPLTVRHELIRRGCTMPQPSEPSMRNVIRGNFFGTGKDWAVLCSRDLASSILVFKDGRADVVSDLSRWPDDLFVQDVGGGRFEFSRAIRTISPAIISEFEGSSETGSGPAPTHDGIDDMFLGKASTAWYWDRRKWIRVGGAD